MAKKLSERMMKIKKTKKIDCRRNEENRRYNKRYKTILKNSIKNFTNNVINNTNINNEDKNTAFSQLDKTIKKICHKGIIHKNKRNRILSRIYKKTFINQSANAQAE